MENNHHSRTRGLVAAAVLTLGLAACGQSTTTTSDPGPTAKQFLVVCTEDEIREPGSLVACPRPGGRSVFNRH